MVEARSPRPSKKRSRQSVASRVFFLPFLCALAAGFASFDTVQADPTGIDYDVLVSAVDPSDSEIAETAGVVTFDGTPETISPLPPVGKPNFGKVLSVDEERTVNADGSETLAFWITAEDSGTLFSKTISTTEPVFGDVVGLHWKDNATPSIILDIRGHLTFPTDPPLAINLVGSQISGNGTPDSPFELLLDWDPVPEWSTATDFHIEIDIAHIPVPAALGPGLIACAVVALRRPRRPRQQRISN